MAKGRYVGAMKKFLGISFALILGAAPLHAQDENNMTEGLSLLQQDTRLLIEGLLQELGPALLELEGHLIDLGAYHVPEILPNGDFIIRRRTPLDPPGESEIDL